MTQARDRLWFYKEFLFNNRVGLAWYFHGYCEKLKLVVGHYLYMFYLSIMHLINIIQSKCLVFPSHVFVPNLMIIIWLNNFDMR